MLVYSEQHLLPIVGGIITLGKPGAYLYVHRTLYDAAVILEDRYKIKERLVQELNTTRHADAVDFFYNSAPSPIRILAPFLSFANEPEELTFASCCGIIHVLSHILDLRKLPTTDEALRRAVDIYVDPEESYILQWKMLIKEWFEFDEINSLADKVTLISKLPEADAVQPQGIMMPQGFPYSMYQPQTSQNLGFIPTAVVEEKQTQNEEDIRNQQNDTAAEIKVRVNEDGDVLLAITEDDDYDDFDALFAGGGDDDDGGKKDEAVQLANNEGETKADEDGSPGKKGLDAMRDLLKRGNK